MSPKKSDIESVSNSSDEEKDIVSETGMHPLELKRAGTMLPQPKFGNLFKNRNILKVRTMHTGSKMSNDSGSSKGNQSKMGISDNSSGSVMMQYQ